MTCERLVIAIWANAFVWQVRENMVEEYLDDISLNDNPYEGMVDECVRRQSQQVFVQSSGRARQSPQNDFVQIGPEVTFPECGTPQKVDLGRLNNSGVKITVNDDGCDVADVETGYNPKWVCRLSIVEVYRNFADHFLRSHRDSQECFGRLQSIQAMFCSLRLTYIWSSHLRIMHSAETGKWHDNR